MQDQKPIPHPSVHVDRKRLDLIKGYVLHEQRTPARALIVTPTQTIGPFHPKALIRSGDEDLAAWEPGAERALGDPMVLRGRVLDGAGRPVPGALVEVWHANCHGKYDHPADKFDAPLDPAFKGFGRALSDAQGQWQFLSIKPQGYPNPGYDNWIRPPHVHFSVYAAGVMHRLITQMYFPDEPLNDIDPILNSIEDLDARACLIAREANSEVTSAGVARVFEFEIVLRGELETPFQLES
jgi:protocatechuate 3,4-dioxygenase beta subunit